jgi:hypothetical protein
VRRWLTAILFPLLFRDCPTIVILSASEESLPTRPFVSLRVTEGLSDSFFIAITVLVVIGLKDLNLLVAIVSRLIVVAVIIGMPVMILKTLLLPKK